MTLRVISGGQTGADRAGLEAAEAAGLETGGWVPAGCRTEFGPMPDLVSRFGCLEHPSENYADRTWANVQMADVTLWYGQTDSRGYKCTKAAAEHFGKPFYENVSGVPLVMILRACSVVNIAGNRASHAPGISAHVRHELTEAFNALARLGDPKTKPRKTSVDFESDL